MTVKVVRGLVNTNNSTPATPQQVDARSVQNSEVTKLAVSQSVNTEAAVTSLRNFRNTSSSEKIKDIKEAKGVAKDVAEKIKSDEATAKNAHNTSSSSAQVAL
jgi:hypothetical protein